MDGLSDDTLSEGVSGSEPSTKWYVVQLKPGGLERAKINLARQGVTTFMPMRKRTIRRATRLIDTVRPLFPGYLFIEMGRDAPPWRSVNGTYGVAKVVSIVPGEPAQVPADFISGLSLMCGQADDYTAAPTSFKTGEQVRIVSGAFANLIARVERTPESERIYVLLELMGRQVRAGIRASDLEYAS